MLSLLVATLGILVSATLAIPTLPTVPPSECRSLMDTIFIVDGSDSISAIDYVKQRKALAAILNELDLGPQQARVGIVVYSSTIAQVVPLSHDRAMLTKQVLNMAHPRDGTLTHVGIAKMIEMFKKDGRQNVPWVSIVITDGLSKFPNDTAQQAAQAKAMGVNMFAVGISYLILREELEAIASSSSQVLELPSFDQLRASLSKLMKVVCPCPIPAVIPFATLSPGGRAIGTRRNYTCEPGFQPIGSPLLECMPDANWNPIDFSCHVCPEPPAKQRYGVLAPGENFIGSTREYVCLKGFTSPEPLVTTCMATPKGPRWTEIPPGLTCAGCVTPMFPDFADPAMAYPSTLIGDTWAFICHKGFIPTGPLETTCISKMGTALWTPIDHNCITCTDPPVIAYAAVDLNGGVMVGMTRTYMCVDGYHPTGPIEATCVGEHGVTSWVVSPHKCIACPNPEMVPNAQLESTMSHLVGTVLVYSCIKGFLATGPIEQACLATAGKTFWDGPQHLCVPCDAPPLLPNTILLPGETLLGTVRDYQCVEGFIPSGPIQVGCIKGTGGPIWTTPEFQCITCLKPPKIPNAQLRNLGTNLVGGLREYECLPGYMPSQPGYVTVECIGEYIDNRGHTYWSPPSHACIACPDAPLIEHGAPEPGDNLIGTSRRYTCLDGFHATGPIVFTCLANATWASNGHECKACGPLPKVEFAQPLDGSFLIGAVREYVCRPGMIPSDDPGVQCMPNAHWSPINFACVRCPEAYPLENAVIEPGTLDVGEVRTYTCMPGYFATGTIRSTCAVPPNGRLPDWSTPVNYCKDCGIPHQVPYATAIPGLKTIGSVQTYTCDLGFVPSAPPHSYCMKNAAWSPPAFKCITCEDPPPILNALVDTTGGLNVGNIRTYRCAKGYISSGPIEYACAVEKPEEYLPPQWNNLTNNFCYDCGEPMVILNGGWLPGPTTIGSIANFVCDKGFAPNGPPEATCSETARWTSLSFQCTGCFSPPILPFSEIIGYTDGDMALVGQSYMYACLGGYKSASPVEVTCLDDLKWSVPSSSCGGCNPKMLPKIPHVVALKDLLGEAIIGTEILYECEKGYLHTNSPFVVCTDTVQWSLPIFECAVTCYDPPTYTDAVVDMVGPSFAGNIRMYTCNQGLHPVGDMSVICEHNGQWSKRNFDCKMCVDPPTDIYVDATIIDYSPRLMGETVQYQCHAGYVPTGNTFITCLPGAIWSPLVIGCSNCRQPPPTLYMAELSSLIPKEGVNVGDSIIYTCLNGYISDGVVSVTCLGDLQWSVQMGQCRGCSPKMLPNIPHGVALTNVLDEAVVGTEILYECEKGYLHTNSPSVVCADTVQWSIPMFECAVTCYDPPTYTDAAVDMVGPSFVGHIRVFTCNQGLHPVGEMSVICEHNGQWSKRNFECKMCVDPPTDIYVDATVIDYSPRLMGETVQYQCQAGYVPTGNTYITCLPGAIWSPLVIGCSNCRQPPPTLTMAELSTLLPKEGINVGDSIIYTCINGYISDGVVSVTCQEDLQWSVQMGQCRGCSPKMLPNIPHGVALTNVLDEAVVGTEILYECEKGYLHTNSPSVVCADTVQWSIPMFECAVTCYDPPTYTDAAVDMVGPSFVGHIRVFTCNQGLHPVGEMSVICEHNGQWSKRNFECKMCVDPPTDIYVDATVIDYSPRLMGETVQYQCQAGHVPTGNTYITCLPGAIWSPLVIGCSNCRQPPPTLYMAELSTLLPKEGINVDDSIIYTCINGYISDGVVSVTCQGDLQWSLQTSKCRGCSPKMLPNIPHGVALTNVLDEAVVGTEILYECEKGYLHTNSPSVVCADTVQWSIPMFECAVTCYDPPTYTDAAVDMVGPSFVGHIRVFTCNQGLHPVGEMSVICEHNGQWSKRNFECKTCVDPPTDIYVDTTVIDYSPRQMGETVQYQCQAGYVPTGNTFITCLPGALWSPLVIGCSNCRQPPPTLYMAELGTLLPKEGINVGDSIIYTCINGYISDGVVSVTCQGDLQWSVQMGQCRGCSPKMLPNIPHGVALTNVLDEAVVGTEILYECEKGYLHTNSPSVVCADTVQWSIPMFECAVTCYDPPTYTDAAVDMVGQSFVGHIRVFTCNQGLHPVGEMSVICEHNGQWSKRNFECKTCVDAPTDIYVDTTVIDYSPRLMGETVQYQCQAGYVPTGNTFITCLPGALWSPLVIGCSNCRQPPPTLYMAELGTLLPKEGINVGDSIIYTCINGYISDGVVSVTCQGDLQWSVQMGQCRGCSPKMLPNIPHGVALTNVLDEAVVGTEILYECEKGYLHTNSPSVVCADTVQWSIPMFECAVTCYDPPTYTDAAVDLVGPSFVGHIRVFTCNQGLHPVGEMSVICEHNGQWSKRNFECKMCVDPPTDIYVDATVIDYSPRLMGETVQYQCQAGYVPTGNTFITCLPGALWSPLIIGCSNCRQPPPTLYMAALSTLLPTEGINVGDSIIYTCLNGYIADGVVSVTCQGDLHWSVETMSCRGCSPKLVPTIAHGATLTNLLGDVVTGTEISYECEMGYLPTSSPSVVCMDNAQWALPSFACAVTCYDPPTYTDAVVGIVGPGFVGDVRVYTCQQGLQPVGEMSVTCEDTGKWSQKNFECKMCVDPPTDLYLDTTMIDFSPRLLGETVQYQCIAGYVATGDSVVTCLPGAVWSPLVIGCSNCRQPPPTLYMAELSSLIPTEGINVGDSIIYTCLNGYIADGVVSVTCHGDLQWSVETMSCRGCSPKLVPTIAHGAALTNLLGDVVTGTEILYECEMGYLHTSSPSVVCMDNAQWALPSFACAVTCYDPPTYKDAVVGIVGPGFVGDVRVYTCQQGLQPVGEMSVTCEDTGKWSQKNFECKMCVDPPTDLYLDTTMIDFSPRLLGETVQYQCIAGYVATGDSVVTCLPGAVWSPLVIGCSNCRQPPPTLYMAELSSLIPTEGINVGDSIIYTCLNGYIADGVVSVTCQGNLQWSVETMSCRGCSPKLVPTIAHGAALTNLLGDVVTGTEISYECEMGYLHTSSPSVVCMDNAQWALPSFACAVTCYDPPTYKDAVVGIVGPGFVGDVRVYTCQQGLQPVGEMSVTCEDTGKWSQKNFECKMCVDPPTDLYLDTTMIDFSPRLLGETVQYQCIAGYVATGDSVVTCLPGAVWSPLVIGCSNCRQPPPTLYMAELSSLIPTEGINVGDSIIYTCLNGYIADGVVSVTCQGNLQWSVETMSCRGCSPKLVPTIAHGAALTNLLGDVVTGTEISYECEMGYLHTSSPSVVCMDNAQWALPSFACAVTCYDPPTYKDAVVGIVGPGFVGDVRVYTCQQGLQPVGEMSVTCEHTGKWSKRNFECKMCVDPPTDLYLDTTMIDFSPRLLGETVQYQCIAGYVATGDTVVTCLTGAVWSPLAIGCSNCRQPPPTLYMAELSTLLPKEGINVGGSIIYTCINGYISDGVVSVTCQGDLQWSAPSVDCRGCNPKLLPTIPRGAVVQGFIDDAMIGTELKYECEKGYLHTNTPSVVCLDSAQWSLPLFECVVTCNDPPTYTDATCNQGGGIFVGDTRTYTCNPDLDPVGDLSVTCLPTGQWSPRAFECRMCDNPTTDIYSVAIDPSPRPLGGVVEYQCLAGYVPTGASFITCLPGATWSPLMIACSNCRQPPPTLYMAELGTLLPKDGINVGGSIIYTCLNGYISDGVVSVTCQGDLQWSAPSVDCRGCYPKLLPTIPRGAVVQGFIDDAMLGTEIKYECEKGYLHTNTPSVVCLDSAQWSIPLFECVVTCYDPPTYTDATCNQGGGIFVGDTRTYTCNPDLDSVGDLSVTCLPTGQWSPRAFECRMCENPPSDIYSVAIDPNPRPLGGVVEYQCLAGYVPSGATFITCLPGAKWSPLMIACSNCGLPPSLPLATPSVQVLDTGVMVGEALLYTCLPGFKSEVPVGVTCQLDLTWTIATSECRGCDMKAIPLVDHSVVVDAPLDMCKIGRRLTYDCAQGFQVIGTPEVECLDTLQWSAPAFSCSLDCGPPLEIKHGFVSSGATTVGAKREYSCQKKWELSANSGVIECLPTGLWSGMGFTCETQPPTTTLNHAYVKDDRCVQREREMDTYKLIRELHSIHVHEKTHCFSAVAVSDQKGLDECLELVSDMYRLSFDQKDHCVKPVYNQLSPAYLTDLTNTFNSNDDENNKGGGALDFALL